MNDEQLEAQARRDRAIIEAAGFVDRSDRFERWSNPMAPTYDGGSYEALRVLAEAITAKRVTMRIRCCECGARTDTGRVFISFGAFVEQRLYLCSECVALAAEAVAESTEVS